jgi:SSS family solute:Na+ symporter
MASVRWVDFAVICVYVLGLTGIGLRFPAANHHREVFHRQAHRPFWAVGMSFLTAMITSVTFIAYPGAVYAKDWALLIPGFLLVPVPHGWQVRHGYKQHTSDRLD